MATLLAGGTPNPSISHELVPALDAVKARQPHAEQARRGYPAGSLFPG